jgi:hypothetical protein
MMTSKTVNEIENRKEFHVAVQMLGRVLPPSFTSDHKNCQFSNVKFTGINPYFICDENELTNSHKYIRIIGKVVIPKIPNERIYGILRFHLDAVLLTNDVDPV